MIQYDWVRLSENYVKMLFKETLSNDIFFHDIVHTSLVVKAACEIGASCGLKKQQIAILQIAAWFHDTGYCYVYHGHEEKSIEIAATFLRQINADEKFINSVTECIAATKMPQKPDNLMQQILCDADMYHLSIDQYLSYAENLKNEWQSKLGMYYSDSEWKELNVAMLGNHKYFTPYGQTILQKNKIKNIERLLAES